MEMAFVALGFVHWAGLALIIVGWVLSDGMDAIHPVMVWGARIQLIIGLALVGLGEASHADLNHIAIGVKLVLALGVVALCEVARARPQSGMKLVHVAGALALVAAAVGFTFAR